MVAMVDFTNKNAGILACTFFALAKWVMLAHGDDYLLGHSKAKLLC
jgi:hypothetical protein